MALAHDDDCHLVFLGVCIAPFLLNASLLPKFSALSSRLLTSKKSNVRPTGFGADSGTQ